MKVGKLTLLILVAAALLFSLGTVPKPTIESQGLPYVGSGSNQQQIRLSLFEYVAQDQQRDQLPIGVAKDAMSTHPLSVGDQLPPHLFPLTINNRPFDLSKSVHQKPTVLIFYRGGWCPFCNLQMGQLQAIQGKLKSMGYQMLAISADNPAHIRQSIKKHHLSYTLLSDHKMAASIAFGLAFKVSDVILQQYKTYHINLDQASGDKSHILPVPAAYVFDRQGKIVFAYSNPNYKVRVNPNLLLRAAKAALKQ